MIALGSLSQASPMSCHPTCVYQMLSEPTFLVPASQRKQRCHFPEGISALHLQVSSSRHKASHSLKQPHSGSSGDPPRGSAMGMLNQSGEVCARSLGGQRGHTLRRWHKHGVLSWTAAVVRNQHLTRRRGPAQRMCQFT